MGDAEQQRRDRFEDLAAPLVDPLRRFLVRRTDPTTADDVLAETLLVCWRRLDELPEEPLPWAIGVARNCLANAQRGVRRQQRLAAKVATLDPPTEVEAADPGDPAVEDERARVRDALDRMLPQEAELLRLWAWEQLGPSEIAQVLDITPNAVSIRLLRAKAKLRDLLGKIDDGGGHEGAGEGRRP